VKDRTSNLFTGRIALAVMFAAGAVCSLCGRSHMPAESRRKLEEMVKGAALPTDLSSLSDGESTTLLHATHIGLSLIAGLRIAVHAPAVTVN
jgi:hypothetical protein